MQATSNETRRAVWRDETGAWHFTTTQSAVPLVCYAKPQTRDELPLAVARAFADEAAKRGFGRPVLFCWPSGREAAR